jgi:flagellar hook-basal body complex protein FliE
MKVELLQPDLPPVQPRTAVDPSAFASALGAIGAVLDGASAAEDAFANGSGSLQHAVYERARADVALSIATAAAQRSAQALNSILNMQI